ncbi:MAG: glycosyltransferase family 4 protein [Flavobacteriia bacterium]|nr:glycosyltransferase family 4 protein [Flavobacteriia bacterium]
MKSKQKNIVIVGKNPPPFYGTSVWFQHLQEIEWENDFKIFFFDIKINESVDEIGKISLKKIFLNIKSFYNFNKFIKENEIDIALISFSQSTLGFLKDSFYIKIAKKQSKCLLMLHGSNFKNWQKNSSFITRLFTKNIFKNTEGIVLLSSLFIPLFKDYFSKEKCFIVPNGIPDDFSFKIKDKNNKFNVVFIGNLFEGKGINDLIEAFLLINNDEIQLKIIGKWKSEKYKSAITSIVTNNSLSIQFLGSLSGNDKFHELEKADLFVFTSNKAEGLPLVLLEASMFSLPIVSTDIGATSEVVENNKNGFLIPICNPKLLAEKIVFLKNNPKLLKSFSLESRRIYENKFTLNQMKVNFEKVFSILAKKL